MNYSLLFLNDSWTAFSASQQQHYLSQIRSLYRQEGWWSEKTDHFEKRIQIISGSHCFVAAVQPPGEILGMGRAISDRASDAYIQDVAVRPEARRQGIGSAIIKLLVNRLEQDGISWIGLIAKSGAIHFYRSAGFLDMADALPMLKTH